MQILPLRNIRLRFLNITDDGVRLLSAKPSLTYSLSLISANITSEAINIMSESPTFR
jgi:hypothetical protein